MRNFDKTKKAGIFLSIPSLIFFTFIFIILILLSVSLVSKSANALVYQINTVCKSSPCIYNQEAYWNISISNYGKDDIEITSFELIDELSTNTFASYKYEGLPTAIYEEAEGGIKINSNQKYSLILNGTVPISNAQNKVVFFPCYGIAAKKTDSYYIAKNTYELKYCSKQNASFVAVECINNTNCQSSEKCLQTKCVSITCGECQFAANHTCNNYACCSDDGCTTEQYCHDNSCSNLNCAEDESFFNHTCEKLFCNENQYLTNHSCANLQCLENEGYIDHKCIKLDCLEDEYLKNHSCIKLDCTQTQGYLNHECVELSCKDNEEYDNYTCKILDCYFFQDPKFHSCINNTKSIIKTFIEVSVILLIVLLLILDIIKVEKKIEKH